MGIARAEDRRARAIAGARVPRVGCAHPRQGERQAEI